MSYAATDTRKSEGSNGVSSGDLVRCLYARHAKSPIAVTNKMNFLNECVDADFVAVTLAGQVIEYEIKVSRSDFLRDRKKLRHRIYSGERRGRLPNRFWYVTAPNIVREGELPQWAGLLEWSDGQLIERRKAPKFGCEKHDVSVLMRLARAMRFRASKNTVSRTAGQTGETKR